MNGFEPLTVNTREIDFMRTGKILAGLFIASALFGAGVAQAAETKITNNSGLPIDELAVSAPGAAKWGANLLEGAKEGSLDSGSSYAVKDLPDGTYDFQISAPDEGVLCTMPNVVVAKGEAVLDAAMGKTCK